MNTLSSEAVKCIIPKNLIPSYNAFIRAANDASLLFESVEVYTGADKCGVIGLCFEITTRKGLSDKRAEIIFARYLKRFPNSSIQYNRPAKVSALEEALMRMS